ncbi:methionine synthase [Candidatus Synechococcus spongiarum]|uniref:Methionine synthase n=1 Tax=Candidatus Synechococcus spongiarum LMB bulk15N TaxID=1943583 RepID=A0A1T1CZL6_9SYNE|nr:methionine synthase [Candidatus Synechococcus spongiarum]OOV33928.1 methionine synthase [Candidatus Synechococcus spongiarum LMB bulk15N]
MARSADVTSAFLQRLHSPERPVLVFDGGTGTSLQRHDLTANDFGGPELEGCNEHLVLTRPDVVQAVHRSFLAVGCDVIETNTFGATPLVLGEYGLAGQAYAINKRGAELAAELAAEFSRQDKPRFVAGSIGPTTKLPTLTQVDFDQLQADFALQAKGLIDGGVDLLLLETCQDVLQIKAGLQGLEEAMAAGGRRLPVMVSVTMETTGTMLVGTDPAAVVTILEPFPIDVLGLNCATGPDLMKPHVRYFSEQSPFVISCIPNAGLPENMGGVAHYRLTPMEMQMALHHFVEDLGVQIIGGCCGTTPAHIEALVQHCQHLKPAPRPVRHSGNNRISPSRYQPAAASIYTNTTYHQDNSFLIIGERLNASGSKKVRELLDQDDWDGLVSIARQQVNENAHLLDVNVDFVGRDGVSDMKALVQRLVTNVNLPLMLDSTEWQKMEAGLKMAGGKCILNSTNYEDGAPRFYKVLELAKRFGAGVVVGTIDEEGMARTTEKKLAIARRAYRDALQYGLPPQELFFDPLALPISTGVEEDRRNAAATLDAIARIRHHMPEVHVVLGISNVSFGLSPAARTALNSVFLHDCCAAGLDAAIVSPIKILPLNKISSEQQKICRDLIHDQRRFAGDVCTYDPLTALTEIFAGMSGQTARTTGPTLADLPVEERLKQHIIDGERLNLEESLELALQTHPPLEIVNRFLLDGMKVVGELFGSGQMQLPFVLQSAQTMKAAVAYLEPHMEKTEGQNRSRGKVLIATVKGDVHDIGKNLVDIILTNNGYEVINLGIKQDVTAIINAQQAHQADCICMSGLLVKSTAFMKDNLAAFNDAGIQVPVILGGAALTPRFVHRDCRAAYQGQVVYGRDAFTNLRFMDAYLKARQADRWDHQRGFLDGIPPGVGLVDEETTTPTAPDTAPAGDPAQPSATAEPIAESTERSVAVPEEPAGQPPFWGTRLLRSHEIPLDEVASYLDRQALFVGQWQLRRSKDQSKADHDALLRTTAEPTLERWLERCRQDHLLQPALAYGYFPCGRRGNSLQVFAPQSRERLGEFVLPRQRSGNRYCIADFYRDSVNNNPTDVLPMQAVTMGDKASAFAQELFRSHAYSDYLYFHGLAVQMAEALAEWIHAHIRRDCGFGDQEPDVLRDVLAQRYRGSRYSFGYPACPNVADSRQQLAWLGAEAIGLTMDSSDQLQPEQSTTALVALHSKARYFSA